MRSRFNLLAAVFIACAGVAFSPLLRASDVVRATEALSTSTVLNASETLSEGDELIYTIEIEQIGTLRVRTAGSVDTCGYLENSANAMLASADDSGEGVNLDLSYSVSPGIYYIRVKGASETASGDITVDAELTPIIGTVSTAAGSLGFARSAGNSVPTIKTFDISSTNVAPGDTVTLHLVAEDVDSNMDAYAVRFIQFGAANPGGIGASISDSDRRRMDIWFDYTIPSNTPAGTATFRAEVGDTYSIPGNVATYAQTTKSVTVAGVEVNSPPQVVFAQEPGSLWTGDVGYWTYAASDINEDLEEWWLTVDGAVINRSAISGGIANGSKYLSFDSPGTHTLTLTARDSGGLRASVSTSVSVSVLPIPSITGPTSPSAILGRFISFNVQATNSPTSFDAQGLPPGLTINRSTGVISGTPTQVGGPYRVQLSATNANGTGTAAMDMLIRSDELSAEIVVTPEAVRPISGSLSVPIQLKGFSACSKLTQYQYKITSGDVVVPLTSWTDFSAGKELYSGSVSTSVTVLSTTPIGTKYTIELSVKSSIEQQLTITRMFEVVGNKAPVAKPGTEMKTTSFRANWNAVAGATGYEVEVSKTSDFRELAFTGNASTAATDMVVTGLESNTLYYYRVRANSANGMSNYSNIVQVVTSLEMATLVSGVDWGRIVRGTDPGAPDASVLGVGTLEGRFDVDAHGAANYSVALKTPPGRAGLEPQLAIGYSSNAGNGPLGVGCSVATGFPQAITRGRSIFARDGTTRGVEFTGEDKYYLDGKRLIAVAGGAAQPAYRTEVDSFMTITATVVAGNIESFVAVDKQGRRFTFGKYANEDDGYQKGGYHREDSLAYAYAIKHVEDTLGNSVHFTYERVANENGVGLGEYVLADISYTGNAARSVSPSGRITFHYNTKQVAGSFERTDRSVKFIGNRMFAQSSRLDSINVTFDGSRVGYYAFGYEAPFGGRLRLKTIQPYLRRPEGDGFMSLRPTTFTWSNEVVATGPLAQRGLPGPDAKYRDRQYSFGDFDGDGKTDYLSGTDMFTVFLGTADGYAAGQSWYSSVKEPYERKIISGDFDGDGKTDILYGDTNFHRLYVLRSTGAAFAGFGGGTAATVIDTTDMFKDPGNVINLDQFRQSEGVALASRIVVGDFTGDGRDDLLLHGFDGFLHLFRSTGTGFAAPQRSTLKGAGWEGFSMFNWEHLFIGNSYPPENYTVQPMPCDLNGDGRTDYAAFVTIRSLDSGGLCYTLRRAMELRLSLEDGDFSPALGIDTLRQEVAVNAGEYTPWGTVIFGVMPLDANNDGLMDFMVLGDTHMDENLPEIERRRWTLYLNRGKDPGTIRPSFEPHYGAIPNTISSGGEEFNTFYTAFYAPGDDGIRRPTTELNDTARARRRIAIESSGGTGIRFVDMNADGFPDLVWYAAAKPVRSSSVAGGGGYGTVSSAVKGWWVMYSTGGLPDSTGACFRNPTRLTNFSRAEQGIWEKATMTPTTDVNIPFIESALGRTVDVNGDGRPDWTSHTIFDGEPWSLDGIVLGQSPGGDLLTSVTDGLGRNVNIAYRAAKDDRIYTPGVVDDPATTEIVEGVCYPIRDIRSNEPVVAAVEKDSGGAAPARFTYQYSGNRLDLSGRGSLGFHSFVTLDEQTKVFKYQFLVQSFPMTGMTHREETYRRVSSDSFSILSSHDNTVVFDKVMSGTGPYGTLFPFISQAVESRWEDGAKLLPTNGLGSSARAESLYTKEKPAGAHITIKAESCFDNASAQIAFPPEITTYKPSDTLTGTSGNSNVVRGTQNMAALEGLIAKLPGQIKYGNLTKLTTSYDTGYIETTETKYKSPQTITGVETLTGLPETVATTVTSPNYGTGNAPLVTYGYKDGTPLVTSETTAGGGNLTFTRKHIRDELGRITATKIDGKDLTAVGAGPETYDIYQVSSPDGFDPVFDLPTSERNALGHTTTTTYHSFLGKPASVTGPNGNAVEYTYDALGRTTKVEDALKELETETQFAADTSVTVGGPSGFTGVAPGAPVEGVSGLTLTSAYRTITKTTARPKVTTYYDRLGRPIRTVKEGFNNQQIRIDTAYNTLGQMIAVSQPYVSGSTVYWTTTAYDALGRVATVTAPNGTVTSTTYKGRLTTVSVDATSLGGVTAAQVNTTLVDPKGRTVKVWNADNLAEDVSGVNGTGGASPSVEFKLDGFGRMRETMLRDGTKIEASYDALGRQVTLIDPDKGSWSYVNSALGYVLQQTDAAGTVTRTDYDPLGRQIRRVATESASVGGAIETAEFFYYGSTSDSTTHQVAFTEKGWIGALQREESATSGAAGYAATNSSTTKAHYYDAKGRPEIELTTADGKWFYATTSYDLYSRVKAVQYSWRPAGREAPDNSPYIWQNFGYRYTYDGAKGGEDPTSRSYLVQVADQSGKVWWDSPDYDEMDRVVAVRKGAGPSDPDASGGLWTKREYRPTDGVLTAIKTGTELGDTSVQSLGFAFDGLGNLRKRTGRGVEESLEYDELNRLKTTKQGTISYDPSGNITNKPDVSGATSPTEFAYNAQSHPHAVRNAFGYSMDYDANGNLTSRTKEGETWSLRWTGFDKPRWMGRTRTGANQASTTEGSEFVYDANRSRILRLEFDQLSGGAPSRYVRKRVYGLGAALEANYVAQTPALAPTWDLKQVRLYIPGPDGVIGAREFNIASDSVTEEKKLIYHYDHLGSIDCITPLESASTTVAADKAGKPGQFSEDAWGQRRDPLDWNGPPVTTDDGGADSLTPRGFTGHEMLDDLGLVHMNGRIYDPLLGRFLSADVVVQSPGDLQSYNRYSYVRNNPLTLIDPSGWFEVRLFGLTFTNEGDYMAKRIVSALKTGDWSGVKEGARSAAQIQAQGVAGALQQTADNIVTQGPIVALELGPVPSPSAASPLLQSVTGQAAVATAESVKVEAAVISGTVAMANQMAGGDIKPADGSKVDQKPPAERERVYSEPKSGEPAKHGDQTRSGSRGEISPAPTDGQTALDNSVVVKQKPNGETRVGVDQTSKEVVVLDRQQQTATQDVFHGHVPEVLKPEVRNVVKKEFPQVRVKKDGTWEVQDPK